MPRKDNTLSRRRSYRTIALMLVLILTALFTVAPVLAENGPGAVHVAYVYSPSCSLCEHSGPAIRSAVDEAKGSGLDVRYAEYSFNSKEGIGLMARYGLDSVPAVVVEGRAIRFEDFNGDPERLKGLIGQRIREAGDPAIANSPATASQYRPPVTLERKITRMAEKDTVSVVTGISNGGDEPVYATVRGGLCEGVRVVSGNASWQGRVMPGEKLYHAYEADIDRNVKALPPQTLAYRDSTGDHSYEGHETPVYLLKGLSVPAVFLAGLVAGINPCLLAVMAFVSAMALSMRGRRLDIIFQLLAFCGGLLAVYLLMGIGFLNIMERLPSIASILKAGIIILLIALAGFAFYEAYQLKKNAERRSFFKSFLDRYKPLYRRYSAAANFGLGCAFGLIKMPCVGGIYVAILGAIIESGEGRSGLLFLAAYNLGVVFPVLALGAVLALGLNPGRVDEFRKRHRFTLKVAAGTILAAMAAVFMLNLI